MERPARRRALWHAAWLACASPAEWRENLHIIERAIAAQMEREFGTA
ncbi:hypothetical protein [Roseovarius sp. THAF8]|nr:hypothetical protein [Roseovarius sp. THAF8]